MRKLFLTSAFLAAAVVLSACRSNVTENGEHIRKAAIVSVISDAAVDKGMYGKTFRAVPAGEKEYSKLCEKYLVNGMTYLGYKKAEAPENADFIVEYSYDWVDGRRRDTSVKLKFIRPGKDREVLWSAVSKCSSRKDEAVRGFLPGLTAGALLFVGRSTHSRTKLANFPAMLKAVEGK